MSIVDRQADILDDFLMVDMKFLEGGQQIISLGICQSSFTLDGP